MVYEVYKKQSSSAQRLCGAWPLWAAGAAGRGKRGERPQHQHRILLALSAGAARSAVGRDMQILFGCLVKKMKTIQQFVVGQYWGRKKKDSKCSV